MILDDNHLIVWLTGQIWLVISENEYHEFPDSPFFIFFLNFLKNCDFWRIISADRMELRFKNKKRMSQKLFIIQLKSINHSKLRICEPARPKFISFFFKFKNETSKLIIFFVIFVDFVSIMVLLRLNNFYVKYE